MRIWLVSALTCIAVLLIKIIFDYAKADDSDADPPVIESNGWVYFIHNSTAIIVGYESPYMIGSWNAHTNRLFIPDQLSGKNTNILDNVFSILKDNASFVVSQNHPFLKALDGVLFNKDDMRLIAYPCAKSDINYVVPDGTQIIGTCAFEYCTSLVRIIIPDSVICIEDDAFHGCSSLASITIPDSIMEIDSNPFAECNNIEFMLSPTHPSLSVVSGALFSNNDKRLIAYPRVNATTNYAVPSGIHIIGEKAFCECELLTYISIPDSVMRIESFAFDGCTSLSSIILPDSITNIGSFAFYGCISLRIIMLSHSITRIESNMFEGCESLTDIAIPSNVVNIEDGAFKHCSSLHSIDIPNGVKSIGNEAFADCKELHSVTIPDSVTNIGDDAFSHCSNLTLTIGRNSYATQYAKVHNLPYCIYMDINAWLND